MLPWFPRDKFLTGHYTYCTLIGLLNISQDCIQALPFFGHLEIASVEAYEFYTLSYSKPMML